MKEPNEKATSTFKTSLKPFEINLYKAYLVDIWCTNSAWVVFRYTAFNFRFKSFYSF